MAEVGQVWLHPLNGMYVYNGQQWVLQGRLENQFLHFTTHTHTTGGMQLWPTPAEPPPPPPPSEEEIAEAIASIRRALDARLDS